MWRRRKILGGMFGSIKLGVKNSARDGPSNAPVQILISDPDSGAGTPRTPQQPKHQLVNAPGSELGNPVPYVKVRVVVPSTFLMLILAGRKGMMVSDSAGRLGLQPPGRADHCIWLCIQVLPVLGCYGSSCGSNR